MNVLAMEEEDPVPTIVEIPLVRLSVLVALGGAWLVTDAVAMVNSLQQFQLFLNEH